MSRHKRKDVLTGGRADHLQPSDFDLTQLQAGTNVELEHTDDVAIAREIAMDHLAEDEDYYIKLAAIDPHLENSNELQDVVYPDSSWMDPDNLWGSPLVVGDPACNVVLENPPAWMPLVKYNKENALDARQILKNYGIQLSGNIKTLLCLSLTRNMSCMMTEWCQKFCYGKSQNFCRPNAANVFLNNFDAFEFLAIEPQQYIDDVAWALKQVCYAFGINNMRVPGIGDFTPGLVRVCDSMTQDLDFIVWGFTRKHHFVMNEMPVRDNLVIWPSIDASMSDIRIQQAIDMAAEHETALSYATERGVAYKPRNGKRPEPPWYNPPMLSNQKNNIRDDFLDDIINHEYISAVFGYHGRGITTHVGNEYPECPATDPNGGGHFIATCQECYWCLEKPDVRDHENLIEHRSKTVVKIPIGEHQGSKVLLDTGERVYRAR